MKEKKRTDEALGERRKKERREIWVTAKFNNKKRAKVTYLLSNEHRPKQVMCSTEWCKSTY